MFAKLLSKVGFGGVRAIGARYGSNFTGIGKLNHVAIAVPNLQESAKQYRDVLKAKVSEPLDLPEHGVTTIFVQLDNTKIELLHPLGDKSPIAKFLEKNKNGGIHHICFEVQDIKAAMDDLSSKGVRLLSKEPRIGAHGKPVCFAHPGDFNGCLVEVEQV